MNELNLIELTQNKINEYGLIGWKAKTDNAKRRFGQCNGTKKTISISKQLANLNNDESIINTIKHEIAHALAGCQNGHNYIWRNECLKMGISAERCFTAKNTNIPKGNYILKCPSCNTEVTTFKKSRKKSACASCCKKHANGRFDERFIFKINEV